MGKENITNKEEQYIEFYKETSTLKEIYDKGYQDGVKDTVKKMFTMDMITIEKIAEMTGLSVKEIEKLTQK